MEKNDFKEMFENAGVKKLFDIIFFVFNVSASKKGALPLPFIFLWRAKAAAHTVSSLIDSGPILMALYVPGMPPRMNMALFKGY